MRKKNSRRKFLKKSSNFLSYFLLVNLLNFKRAFSYKKKPKIVIVGYGIGGATCLQYLLNFSNILDISIIEKSQQSQTCPMSNLVISNIVDYEYITHKFNYKKFKNINFLNEAVTNINIEKKTVKLEGDKNINYDFLILSPGVGFKNDIEGYNYNDKNFIPHCWTGSKDILVFKKKLNDLDNNSTIIISSPDYPYRCPPAPYERACLVANLLSKMNKKFKILLLDSKNSFTKQDLFQNEWKNTYKNKIEWVSRKDGGKVTYYDHKNKFVKTSSGNRFFADFIHIIPNQQASKIITNSNLNEDNDWCSVNPITFELKNFKNIFVIGDSVNAWDMPKSAFSANSQAKVLVANLINRIIDKKFIDPVFLNTCYSFASSNRAFSITSWYKLNADKNKIVSLGSSSSDVNGNISSFMDETRQAFGWYESLVNAIYY